MEVLKFGGTSVADADRIGSVARIIADRRAHGPVVVVVSAMAGVTDGLLRVAEAALAGDPRWPALLHDIGERHRATLRQLVAGDDARAQASERFERLWLAVARDAAALADSAGEAPVSAGRRAFLTARFSGWGEQIITGLLALAVDGLGVVAGAVNDAPVALRDIAGTKADPEPSVLATRAWLLPRLAMLTMRGGVPILPGYIARDPRNEMTTLGRNGSDVSAAVIAAALGAARLTIYSDVPGLLTADPRIAPDAALLPILTYDEAQRVADAGAKALHPRAVDPVRRAGITLRLRSTFQPDAPGTDIVPEALGGFAFARDEAWAVASRLVDGYCYAELTAQRLPAWSLLTAGHDADCDCAQAAVAAVATQRLPVEWRSCAEDHLSLRIPAAEAPALVRLLDDTLRAEASVCATRASGTLATGA